VTDVIFPLGNQKEYEDVPEDLKQGITPHFVDNYEQVKFIVLASTLVGLVAAGAIMYARSRLAVRGRESQTACAERFGAAGKGGTSQSCSSKQCYYYWPRANSLIICAFICPTAYTTPSIL
jgi:hypothetical protein